MPTSFDEISSAAQHQIIGNSWDKLAELDPLWVILHEPGKRYGRWSPEEFFATGEAEMGAVLDKCRQLGIALKYERALDFGCGVGRLTRSLASKFSNCVGIDISDEMVSRARDFNKELANCEFVVNHSDVLPFPNSSFDFVSSFIVLQHMQTKQMIRQSITEFVRVLRPGGAIVFQLPDKPSLRRRIQMRRRIWSLLRFLRVPERFLYETLGLTPIKMNGLPPSEVRAVVENGGAQIIQIEKDHMGGPNTRSYSYFVLKKELP